MQTQREIFIGEKKSWQTRMQYLRLAKPLTVLRWKPLTTLVFPSVIKKFIT